MNRYRNEGESANREKEIERLRLREIERKRLRLGERD